MPSEANTVPQEAVPKVGQTRALKPQRLKRTKSITVRFSTAELAEIVTQSRGAQLSRYVRVMALGERPIFIPEINVHVWGELSTLLENLNSIVVLHRESDVDFEQLSMQFINVKARLTTLRMNLVGATR